MTQEQRTPDELICEKLLGWKQADGGWLKQDGFMYAGCGTPSFTTWADAGLILDKLQSLSTAAAYRALKMLDGAFYNCRLTPAAIRAAALSYIRSL